MSNLTNLENHNNLLTNINTTITNIKAEIHNLPNYLDTSDATAVTSDILLDKTAYVNGVKLTGDIPIINNVEMPSSNIYFREAWGGRSTVITIQGVTNNNIYIPNNSSINIQTAFANIASAVNLSPSDVRVGKNLGWTEFVGTYTSDANATVNDIAYGKTAYVNGQMLVGNLATISNGSTYPATNIRYYNSPINRLYYYYNQVDLLLRNNAGLSANDSQIATAINLQPNQIKSGVSIFGVNGNVQSVSNNGFNFMKYLPITVEDGVPYLSDDIAGQDFIYPVEMEYADLTSYNYFSVLDRTNNTFKLYWTDDVYAWTIKYDSDSSQIICNIASGMEESVYCSTLQVNNIDVLPIWISNSLGINSAYVENLSQYSWNTINMSGQNTTWNYNLYDTNLEYFASLINYNIGETELPMEAKWSQIREGYGAYDKFGKYIKGTLPTRTNSGVLNTKIVPSVGNINVSPRFAGYYATSSVIQINNLGLASKIGLTADKLKSGESILDITGNYAGSGGYILQDGMRFSSSNRVFNNGVGWDTSNVTTMASLFSGCALLPYVDVSNWDTSNVVYMDNVFMSCQTLNNLDISNWNTSNVKSMSKTFYGCSSVTNLNVSNWDTGNLTETVGMFCGCSNLDTIDVSNWNTSKIITTSTMFDFCVKLNNITVNTWNVANIQTMNRMFNSCRSLTELNLSEWNTHKVTDMSYMFHNCVNLINISFTNWNTINMLNMEKMFLNCNNLSSETYSNIVNMLPDANQLTNKYVTNLGINESKLNLRQKDDLTIKGYTVESITPPEPILDL